MIRRRVVRLLEMKGTTNGGGRLGRASTGGQPLADR